MKSWHIWDFPENIYILLNKRINEEFFNEVFKKCGGKRPYARFLGLTQKAVKQYHRRCSFKYGKKHVQSIPLINNNLKRKIENNINIIKIKNKGTPIKNPKLPIKESPEFYRIVAHIIGDGFGGENKVPYYCNTCKKLRKKI